MKMILPLTELLAGLSEECCELGRAALKLRRVYDGGNPTPTTEREAIDNLEEEIADVMVYLSQIPYSKTQVEMIREAKTRRMEERCAGIGS